MEIIIKPYTEKIKTILLIGPPGAGKGTLGRILDQSGSQKYVSTGAIFRSLDPDSPAGDLYYSYAKEQKLVPDEVTLQICRHYIQGLIASNAFFPSKQYLLLEGFPRNEKQAQILLDWLDVKHVIVLECLNKENLRKRLHRRARLEGKFHVMTEEEFDYLLTEYEREKESILNQFPVHSVSIIEADQKPLEVLKQVLMRLSHILSTSPDRK
jgi:adenylate kinase